MRTLYPLGSTYRKDAKTMEFLEKLSLAGLVPVIAINDAEDAVPL